MQHSSQVLTKHCLSWESTRSLALVCVRPGLTPVVSLEGQKPGRAPRHSHSPPLSHHGSLPTAGREQGSATQLAFGLLKTAQAAPWPHSPLLARLRSFFAALEAARYPSCHAARAGVLPALRICPEITNTEQPLKCYRANQVMPPSPSWRTPDLGHREEADLIQEGSLLLTFSLSLLPPKAKTDLVHSWHREWTRQLLTLPSPGHTLIPAFHSSEMSFSRSSRSFFWAEATSTCVSVVLIFSSEAYRGDKTQKMPWTKIFETL